MRASERWPGFVPAELHQGFEAVSGATLKLEGPTGSLSLALLCEVCDRSSELAGVEGDRAVHVVDGNGSAAKVALAPSTYEWDGASLLEWTARQHPSSTLHRTWPAMAARMQSLDAADEHRTHIHVSVEGTSPDETIDLLSTIFDLAADRAGWSGFLGLGAAWGTALGAGPGVAGYGPVVLTEPAHLAPDPEGVRLDRSPTGSVLVRPGPGGDLVSQVAAVRAAVWPGWGYNPPRQPIGPQTLALEGPDLTSPFDRRLADVLLTLARTELFTSDGDPDRFVASPVTGTIEGADSSRDLTLLDELLLAWCRPASALSIRQDPSVPTVVSRQDVTVTVAGASRAALRVLSNLIGRQSWTHLYGTGDGLHIRWA